MRGNIEILLLIILPVISGLLGFFLGKKKVNYSEWVMSIATIAELAIMSIVLYKVLACGETVYFRVKEVALIGLNFRVDGFRAIYGFLTALAWALTSIFSLDYLKGEHHTNRYRMFFQFTLASTMAVFMSDSLYTLFVFFEIMSFVSFPLVIQEETKDAKKAGMSYFTVAIIGGLLILMGFVLVMMNCHTHDFAAIKFDNLRSLMEEGRGVNTPIFVAGILMLLGFGAKASLFPLHTWLPVAHPVAPAPASAILSAILTKTGMMGMMIVVCDLMFPSEVFGKIVLVLGTITMVLGGVLALLSNELKRTLACSSMSQIGFITVGLAMRVLMEEENAIAARGAFLHMINHTLFKISLFCIAGVCLHHLGTGELNKIKGFGKGKPIFHIGYLLSAMGIAGIPGLNGYISKTLIHESLVVYGNSVFEWLFLISGGLTFAYMLKLYIVLFFEHGEAEKDNTKLGIATWVPFIVPVICYPIMGLMPTKVMDPISEHGFSFLHIDEELETVHYFNWENLKGGVISIVIGLALYLIVVRLFLRKKEGEEVVYHAGIPAWLSLEDRVYRPCLIKVLPAIGGFIAGIFDHLVDNIVCFLKKYVFFENRREPKEREVKEHPWFKEYVLASKTVSYGLLLFAAAFVFVITYLLMR